MRLGYAGRADLCSSAHRSRVECSLVPARVPLPSYRQRRPQTRAIRKPARYSSLRWRQFLESPSSVNSQDQEPHNPMPLRNLSREDLRFARRLILGNLQIRLAKWLEAVSQGSEFSPSNGDCNQSNSGDVIHTGLLRLPRRKTCRGIPRRGRESAVRFCSQSVCPHRYGMSVERFRRVRRLLRPLTPSTPLCWSCGA